LYLTTHAYIRSKQRGIIPEWLHKQTANDFILGLINQTSNEQIIKYNNGLMKILLPGFKAYVRDHEAIVTLVKRRRKVG
jgi:hypothetical protein